MHPVIELCDDQSFLRAVGKDFDPFPVKYLRMADEMGLDAVSVFALVPKHRLASWQDGITAVLESAREDVVNRSYENHFRRIRKFLSGLMPPLVDIDALQTAAKNAENQSLSAKLQDFMPEKRGRPRRTVYSNIGSVTGRLTVTSGPNPLTMSAEIKSCLLPSRGCLLQLDVASAEPRTALHAIGKHSEGDVYSAISESVFEGRLDRATSKLATICALYGQSPKNLAKMLPSDVKPHEAILGVRSFFGVETLLSKIKNDASNGKMRNALGRPVIMPESDSMILSYFLQSSAAEISILLFDKFCDAFSEQVDPVYVIHDALIVDCDEDLASNILSRGSIKIKHGNWSYDLKATRIN